MSESECAYKYMCMYCDYKYMYAQHTYMYVQQVWSHDGHVVTTILYMYMYMHTFMEAKVCMTMLHKQFSGRSIKMVNAQMMWQ